MIPDKIYINDWSSCATKDGVEYIRKETVLDAIRLAYGKVSMNPFDSTEAFEKLIKEIEKL